MKTFSRFVILGSLALLMGSPIAGPSAGAVPQVPRPVVRGAQVAKASGCFTWKRPEKAFARKHNAERKLLGLGTMRLDVHLGRVARKHTNEMINKNQLYHTSSTTLGNRVTRWLILGENVGVGSSVASLHEAFMNSPSHKANILYTKFRHVGVGTRKKNGRLWVTVIFEATNDPGTTLKLC